MPLLVAVSALSGAALAYEILLTRLFSIMYWHHYAYMIISVALLGYGASGTFVALLRDRLAPHLPKAFAGFALAFAVAAIGTVGLVRAVPFNPLEILWDPTQQGYLLLLYLLLALPFFCAATAIALAITHRTTVAGRVYRADLFGAGTGALAILGLLFLLPAEAGLRLVSGLGIVAAALAALSWSPRRAAPVLLGLAVALPLLWPGAWIAPTPSPYKGLSLALQAPGARVLSERSSPLGLLTVVESPTIPFRHAPGASLFARHEPPAQLAVFTDADGLTAINRWDGQPESLAWLDEQTAALPFHLLDRPRVLVLGAGGGSDVLLALFHEAARIDAVELNPQLGDLVRRDHADFAGQVYAAPTVRLHTAEARKFVETAEREWDLIQVSLLDSFSASAAGAMSLSESTLYTVEALSAYLERLAPGGLLAVTRWLKLPPRDGLKLFATAVAALERTDVDAPETRLALIRGPNTSTLLVKTSPFEETDVAALKEFSAARGFDLAWYPGMRPEEANRINRLPEPYLYAGARALLGPERDAFLARYKFHIAPATDDRPYFFRFFKWRILPEVLAMRGRAGLALLEGGYLVLAATLVQAVVAGLVLILLPLRWLGPATGASAEIGRWRVAGYFGALGLAFLFVEIAFIQRFVLFLGHPLYAIAVVLTAFLLFAGLGSGFVARRDNGVGGGRGMLPMAVAGIVLLSGSYLLLLPQAFAWLAPAPQPVQIGAVLALIAPLAFCMGIPFPLGLARVKAAAPALAPWAWGINGCASVVSAVLASLLAMHFGFSVVLGLAMLLYLGAALAFRH